jgi:hypothetical protein
MASRWTCTQIRGHGHGVRAAAHQHVVRPAPRMLGGLKTVLILACPSRCRFFLSYTPLAMAARSNARSCPDQTGAGEARLFLMEEMSLPRSRRTGLRGRGLAPAVLALRQSSGKRKFTGTWRELRELSGCGALVRSSGQGADSFGLRAFGQGQTASRRAIVRLIRHRL